MTNVAAQNLISNLIVSDDWKDDEGLLLPNAIYKHMRHLTYEVVVPPRGKMGPTKQLRSIGTSYPNAYSSCTLIQQEKVVKHWAGLTPDVKKAVLVQSRNYEKDCSEDIRSQNISVHEMARIGKLEASVCASSAWAMIRRPLTRQELDAKQGGDTSTRNDVCPWSMLHEIFMNPDPTYSLNEECINESVCHGPGGT